MAPSAKRRTNHARRRHLGGHERQDERARKLAARVAACGGAKSRPATTECCRRFSDAAPRVTGGRMSRERSSAGVPSTMEVVEEPSQDGADVISLLYQNDPFY